MKVFVIDQGVYGGQVVVAETKEQAIEIMVTEDNVAGYNYSKESLAKIRKGIVEGIEEIPLVNGSSYLFMGDR